MLGTGASNYVQGVDEAFFFIMGIGVFFLILITTLIVVFVIRYNRKKHTKAVQVRENYLLELTWTIIPLIIVIAMFFYGYNAYLPARNVPDNAMKITAIGRMWSWSFVYENGKESEKLYVPFNQPVVLTLKSLDVVHSLFIPAFRIKEDMVPGKDDNFVWFIPTEIDTFDILCTEYCGLRHSFMVSEAIVLPDADFKLWLAKVDSGSVSGKHPGFEILKNNACTGCHSVDGSKLVGPSFKGLFMSERQVVEDGVEKTVKADSLYIRESILEPDNKVVKGFAKGLMKSYKGTINDENIGQIIQYLRISDGK